MRRFHGYVAAALAIGLLAGRARANDAGLGEIAAAVRHAELYFTRDSTSAENVLAAIRRAPPLVQSSLAVRYAQARLFDRLGRHQEALASWPSDDEAKRNAGMLGVRVANDLRLRRARTLVNLLRCEEALLALSALENERAFPGNTLNKERARCVPATTPVKPPAPLTLEQRMARAEQLTGQGRGEEALALLDAATKGKDKLVVPKTSRARFAHLRGMALFRMRTRYPEAARVLQAASGMASATAEEDAFHAARAIARSDQNVRAAKALRAFTRRFPKSKHVSEALYLAAWLELRVDHPGAEKALATWLDSAIAKLEPGLMAEARVELGMRALRAGKHAVAAERFAAYAAGAEGCLERGRGLYWGARAELAKGNKEQAIAHWAEATQIEPLCWYALLARNALRELGEPMPPAYPSDVASLVAAPSPGTLDGAVASTSDAGVAVPVPVPVPVAVPVPIEPSAAALPVAEPVPPDVPIAVALPKEAAFYAALGFDADAVSALRSDENAVRASAPPGLGLQALVNAYTALGEHARPRALVHQAPLGLLTRAPSAETAFALRAAYARPHRELVRQLAVSEQVDEDLIYAIMLKESAFDPRVVSNADAIGLMQLLPGTGKMVGKGLELTVTRESLLDPEDNIRLGVRLLKQLLSRYHGQLPLAAAAYNAGSQRVDEWLARAARAKAKDDALALDRFVEDIPIEQTRNYVRRVMAFYARYRYLGPDGRGDGPIIELPAAITR